MPDIAHAIVSLRPDACFTLDGNSYEGITWLSDEVPKPSKEEAEAELARLQAEYDAQEYARKRAAEYPNMADVIVALAEKEEGRPEMWNAITAKRQEIRDRYPK